MRWYITIGTILMAILLTACSVNANAGNSDTKTVTIKNEDVSGEYTDMVEIIKKVKGTEINLSETTEVILVDGTTGRRIVIDDKDTVKSLVDEFSSTKFTYINEGEDSGGYTYRVAFCNNDKTVLDCSFMGDSRIRISPQEFISSENALNSFKVVKEMFATSTGSADNTEESQGDNFIMGSFYRYIYEDESENNLLSVDDIILPDTLIIDSAECDVDGDGKIEKLAIIPRTDNDKSAIVIIASLDEKVKYFSIINLNPDDVSFNKESWKTSLAIAKTTDDKEKEYKFHDLYINNDNIYISGLEELTENSGLNPKGCYEIEPDDNEEQLIQLIKALDTSYTDFSQSIYEMIANDWEKYNSMDNVQRMLSSHMPGICSKQFENWSEAIKFVGVEPWNPFENEEWLSGTNEYRVANRKKNSMMLDYNTEFYGDADGKLNSISLSSNYPLASGFVNLVINLGSETTFSAWPDNEKGGKTRFYKDVFYEDGTRTITIDVLVVHTDNYDAIRIALPEATNFKYLVSVTSYNGTEELAKMFDKAAHTLGLDLTYKIILEGVPSADSYMDIDQIVNIAQDYVASNLAGHDGQVIDIENPAIEKIYVLPDFYYHLLEVSTLGEYYKVTFTTNLDDVLGPIGVYVDYAGNIIGLDYRE